MISASEVDQLIESLRSYARSPELADAEMLRDESVAYNDLCHDINARMRAAGELIDRGLRDDAIELANREGDLLSIFEKLDFPERNEWIELVRTCGYQPPPELEFDAAIQLNTAHAVLGDLEGLLKNHRLLALARSPLPERITVLNALARKDADNPIWQTDAAVLQRGRIDQLREEVQSAAASLDATKLRRLEAELTGQRWWIPLPPTWLPSIRTALARADRVESLRRFSDLGEQLLTHFAAYDVAAAERTVAELDAVWAAADPPADHPSLHAIEPAISWVRDHQRHTAEEQRAASLIETLAFQLDAGAPRPTIESALVPVEGLGERAPVELIVRARERIDSFDMVTRRRSILFLAAGVLTLAVISTATGVVLYQRAAASKIAGIEAAFQSLIADQKWDEASRFLESIDPLDRQRGIFRQGQQSIASAAASEQSRAAAFADVNAQLEASDFNPPNYALIGRLRELAVAPEELNVVAGHESRAEDFQMNRREQSDARFTRELDDLQSRVDKIFARDEVSPERSAAIDNLIKQSKAFIASASSSGPAFADAASELVKLLSLEKSKMSAIVDRAKAIGLVTAATGDSQRYVTELQRFVATYPDDPNSRSLGEMDDIEKSLRDTDLWLAVVRHPAYQSPTLCEAATADTWLKLLRQAIEVAPEHPVGKLPTSLRPHYEKMIGQPAAIESIGKIFKSSLLQKMYVYARDRGEQKYYSPMSPDRTGDKPHIVTYWADTALLRQEVNFGLDYPKLIQPRVVEAGHWQFAERCRPVAGQLREGNFTQDCFQILDVLHKTDTTKIDPFFKVFLLERLLSLMCPASEPMERAYGTLLADLQVSGLDWSTNWLSPGDSDPRVVEARTRAQNLLDQVTDWDDRKSQLVKSFNAFRQPRPPVPEPVGWIAVVDGKPVAIVDQPGMSGTLIAPTVAGTSIRFQSVGRIDGQTSVVVKNVDSATVGMPVYRLDAP